MEATMERVAPLLRVDQVEEMEGEKEALQRKLASPHIEDKGTVAEQLRRLDRQLETQRPRAYEATEIDGAVAREAYLRGQWLQGMLSQEEMRKCPPGAVDRHRQWEKRNKPLIAEWQNIQRRLNADNDDRESASIERFRTTANSMNLDNALIPGKQFFLPPANAALPVAFNAEQLALLEALHPGLREKLAVLDNVQRASVKELVQQAQAPSVASIAGHAGAKKKREMGQQQKDALARGRAKAAANRAANKAPE